MRVVRCDPARDTQLRAGARLARAWRSAPWRRHVPRPDVDQQHAPRDTWILPGADELEYGESGLERAQRALKRPWHDAEALDAPLDTETSQGLTAGVCIYIMLQRACNLAAQ